MATIIKEFFIAARPDDVWAALRDFHAVHERVAPGFLSGATSEGDDRIVSFANGMVARERLMGIDDGARRIAYSVVEGRPTHHNASAQVFADGQGSRFVWIADVLPDALAGPMGAMMDEGAKAMKRALERQPAFETQS